MVAPLLRPASLAEAIVCLMALGSGILFYLEVWGVLSRGYTLGVLPTILNAGRPRDEIEISSRYRGGEGHDWIMRHCVGGLLSARMLERQRNRLVLTPVRCHIAAWLYQISVITLGLHKTG
jgi:hypothetical protein